MKFSGHTYNQIGDEASLLSKTAAKLSLAFELNNGEHLKDKELISKFEERQLILIKDSIARMYSTLDLWNVKGHIDQAFEYKDDQK